MEEQRVSTSLTHTLWGLLAQPSRAMVAVMPNLRAGTLVVVGLILATGIESTLKVVHITGPDIVLFAIVGTAIGILSAWLGLTLLLHLIARALGGTGSYRILLALMGYAAAPMILAALVSSVVYIISPVLWPDPGGTLWGLLHDLIGWIGMTWGWPGLLTYYALRHGERLPAKKARAIVVAVYVVMVIGWFLPVLVPGWFT